MRRFKNPQLTQSVKGLDLDLKRDQPTLCIFLFSLLSLYSLTHSIVSTSL